MIKKINFLFVTLFGIGKISKIPGSIASLVTIIFLFFLFHILSINVNTVLIFIIIVFFISLYSVNIFIKDLDNNPGEVRSLGYDIVMNGYEIGGGSIRIHNKDLQSKIFTLLDIDKNEANEKFGFLMNAFQYGAPPHGGMAFGFDRLIMLLVGSKQIRDVIAFPKTTSAMSLMDDSPSNVDSKQLNDLSLLLKDKK